MVERMSKSRLTQRIQRSWSEVERLIRSLTVDELTQVTSPDGWTVKDHLAHLAVWEAGIVALLDRRPRFAAMGLDEMFVAHSTEEEVNARIFQMNKSRPLPEVLEELRETHRGMMKALEQLNGDELYQTYSYFQPGELGEDRGIPVVEWIKGNTYDHFDSHVEWIRKLVRK